MPPALEKSVDGVLETLSGFEFRLLAGRDADRLACARIAAFGSRALADQERAETDEPNFVARLQGRGNPFENRIDCLGRVGLRQASTIRDVSNEVVLIHLAPPLNNRS